jgi:tetratricopeptide (TPR) repeat protein
MMDIADQARLLFERAVELTEAEDPAAALEASTSALELYRSLAATDPERYQSDMLRVLQNRAWIYACLHRIDDYLLASADVIRVCRALAARRPNEFRAVLATELNNVSLTLAEREDRIDAAVAFIRESVDIARDVSMQLCDEDTQWQLALALANLSRILERTGDHSSALHAAEEYAALTRELARAKPETFGNPLALSLTMLASRLSRMGRFEDALSAVMQAVTFHRQQQVSVSYYPAGRLADALNELSIALLALHRPSEALRASEEAIGYLTELESMLGIYTSQFEEAQRQYKRVREVLDSGQDAVS